jgi:hypothetical protein
MTSHVDAATWATVAGLGSWSGQILPPYAARTPADSARRERHTAATASDTPHCSGAPAIGASECLPPRRGEASSCVDAALIPVALDKIVQRALPVPVEGKSSFLGHRAPNSNSVRFLEARKGNCVLHTNNNVVHVSRASHPVRAAAVQLSTKTRKPS